LPGGVEESHEKPVRIADVSAEIRTKHFLNTSQECYCYGNPFGLCKIQDTFQKITVLCILLRVLQLSQQLSNQLHGAGFLFSSKGSTVHGISGFYRTRSFFTELKKASHWFLSFYPNT
jgi:hypothetical protein